MTSLHEVRSPRQRVFDLHPSILMGKNERLLHKAHKLLMRQVALFLVIGKADVSGSKEATQILLADVELVLQDLRMIKGKCPVPPQLPL